MDPMIKNIILPQIGLAQENKITPYTGSTVLWKGHTENRLCLDPMIQNMILPQIDLAQDKTKNNAIQKAHCVLETQYREDRCALIP